MKITNRQLRRLIREALSADPADVGEEELLAELTPLLQGQKWDEAAKMLLSIMSYADMQLELDDSELASKLRDLGLSSGWTSKLEDAAWKLEKVRMDNAIKNDPDKGFLAALGDMWSSSIEPDDLESLGWKEYKKYVRLSPPESISHGVNETNENWRDVHMWLKQNGVQVKDEADAKTQFLDFLNRRSGKQLGKRKPYKKSPPPYYD